MKKSVSCTQRSTCSQILYYALERWTRTHSQTLHGKKDWRGSKVHQNTELWTKLMVSQWNSSGISSQDSPHCSSVTKSKSYCQDWAYNQKTSLDGLSSCRCSTTSHGDLKTIKKNANQVLNSFLSMRRDLEQDNGQSSDLEQKRNGTPVKTVHKENGTELQTSIPIHESIIQKSVWEPRWWKIVNTLAPTRERLKPFFAQLFL